LYADSVIYGMIFMNKIFLLECASMSYVLDEWQDGRIDGDPAIASILINIMMPFYLFSWYPIPWFNEFSIRYTLSSLYCHEAYLIDLDNRVI